MTRRTRRRLIHAAALGAALATVSAYAATRPDPMTDSVADGCKRDRIGIFLGRAPNWVYVNDRNHPAAGPPPPAQWVKGYARSQFEPWAAAQPTAIDMPTTHSSYDFVTNVAADPEYQFLIAGDEARRIGNFKDQNAMYARLHTEREEAAFPLWAWPDVGDRVEMRGSWVWDCDHAEEGEHSELHPPHAVWVQRGAAAPARTALAESQADLYVSTDGTPAATQANCAHSSKGDEAAFRACVRGGASWVDVSGAYSFFLPAPGPRPKGAKLRIRVVDRGSTRGVRVRTFATRSTVAGARGAKPGVRVTLTVRATANRRLVVAKQIFARWSPTPAARLPEHLRVTLRRLHVRRAMDPGCPPGNQSCVTPQTTRGDQNSRGPEGEFVLYVNAAGVWQRVGRRPLRARDGQNVRLGQTIDVYVPRGRPWRLFVTGRECDNGLASSRGPVPVAPCPQTPEFAAFRGDDDPGFVLKQFRSPAASVGIHSLDARLDGSTCPIANRRGCFALEIRVTRVRDAAARRRRAG